MSNPLRFALLGAGFWARYQLAAWNELAEDARCVAVCDPARDKADALARAFGVPGVYTDPGEMLERERPDFIDIVTPPPTHAPLVMSAAARGVSIICQKPMAMSFEEAEAMVAACRAAGVPFLVHENYRWQRPFRELKRALDSGVIGRPFRARLDAISGFPVFANQPGLKELEQFILTDMGSHVFDMARFLFGEARDLYCRTARVHPDIRGEDVATALLTMGHDVTVVCNLALAETPLEIEKPVETFAFIEGERGSLELGPDYWVRRTTAEGTLSRRFPPTPYPWALPDYLLSQSSMVACLENLLSGLRGDAAAETTGEDNLQTVRLVFAAYDSARERRVVTFDQP